MKKILIILMFLLFSKVSALVVPENIYYVDGGLYAYLTYDSESNYCLETECTLYVEYQYKEIDADIYQNIEKVEVTKEMKILLLEPNTLDFQNLLIRSRYLTIDSLGNYDYSEWTQDQAISTFEIDQLPTPIIKNLNLEDEQLYQIDNELEINNYLKDYLKYYNQEIIYILQYRINDETWLEEKLPSDLNLNDIKLEIRLKYKVGDNESKLSNTLTYENHPVVEQCLFDSELCCTKIMNVSICLWLLILFLVVVISLIIIENVNRRKREA